MSGEDALRSRITAAMPEHQSWCHAEAHADCCNADDCDCGVTDSLARLLPVVLRYGREKAAAAWGEAADELELSGLSEKHWAVAGLRARSASLTAQDPT